MQREKKSWKKKVGKKTEKGREGKKSRKSMDSSSMKMLISYIRSSGAGLEVEVRLGEYERGVFKAGVDIVSYKRLKDALDAGVSGEMKRELRTKEWMYEGDGENVRKVEELSESGGVRYERKTRVGKLDMREYDIRVSRALEEQVSKEELIGLKLRCVREKERKRYIFDIGEIDLTIVRQSCGGEVSVKYEVELELRGYRESNRESIEGLINFMKRVVDGNSYIMSKREKKKVISEYKRLTGQNKEYVRFVGAQPETLQKSQLSNLRDELYSVTDKADGRRYMLYINNVGEIYYIDNKLNVLKTDIKACKVIDSLIDGELIEEDDNTKSYYGFDIMISEGVDLRGREEYKLKERLSILEGVISNISNGENYKVYMKKFIYRNVFLGSEMIMNSVSEKRYKNDGLIFTPMEDVYPLRNKWSKLLKWKPASQNTIDFYSKKRDGTLEWDLYVNDGEKDILFDVSKLNCDMTHNSHTTYRTTMRGELDPTTGEEYQDSTVIEYMWDGERFKPLRTRWDKIRGNYYEVACSIWRNINDPITEDMLYNFS